MDLVSLVAAVDHIEMRTTRPSIVTQLKSVHWHVHQEVQSSLFSNVLHYSHYLHSPIDSQLVGRSDVHFVMVVVHMVWYCFPSELLIVIEAVMVSLASAEKGSEVEGCY